MLLCFQCIKSSLPFMGSIWKQPDASVGRWKGRAILAKIAMNYRKQQIPVKDFTCVLFNGSVHFITASTFFASILTHVSDITCLFITASTFFASILTHVSDITCLMYLTCFANIKFLAFSFKPALDWVIVFRMISNSQSHRLNRLNILFIINRTLPTPSGFRTLSGWLKEI